MEYSQILLEMLERIKVLEGKVKTLEDKLDHVTVPQASSNSVQLNKVSLKYRKLAEYLLKSNEIRVTLSYSQIEEILGFPLPDTARNFKASFWANTRTHSYASSWMEVGYKAKVDADHDTVTFIKNLC